MVIFILSGYYCFQPFTKGETIFSYFSSLIKSDFTGLGKGRLSPITDMFDNMYNVYRLSHYPWLGYVRLQVDIEL